MKKILRTIIMLLAVLAVPSVAHAEGTFTATGDVNDDGSVNISDVTALIDHLLGGTSGSFNVANADVDADRENLFQDAHHLFTHIIGVIIAHSCARYKWFFKNIFGTETKEQRSLDRSLHGLIL